MNNISKKLIIVGDDSYVPTVFDSYTVDVPIGSEKTLKLSLFDTAGQEEYDRLRVLSYLNTDIALMCFSVDSPKSLENVLIKWTPELHHYCKDVPVILVGTKTDLRDDICTITKLSEKGECFVSVEQTKAVAKSIKAADYMECSSKNKIGVNELMTRAIELAVKPRKNNKGVCSCL